MLDKPVRARHALEFRPDGEIKEERPLEDPGAFDVPRGVEADAQPCGNFPERSVERELRPHALPLMPWITSVSGSLSWTRGSRCAWRRHRAYAPPAHAATPRIDAAIGAAAHPPQNDAAAARRYFVVCSKSRGTANVSMDAVRKITEGTFPLMGFLIVCFQLR